MNLRVRKRLPHEVPQWVTDGSWFFVTIVCEPQGDNQLCLPSIGPAVLGAMQHNHERLVWHCRLCLLMPDHLHAIIAFSAEPGLRTVVANWKRFTSRKTGVRWQRDFFDHRLRNDQELQEKTSYVLMNPVRRGLCDRMEDWKWVYRPNDRPPPSR